MLSTSDPLFWMIAAGMTLPWGLVVWLGMEAQRQKGIVRDLLAKPFSFWEQRERNRTLLKAVARSNRRFLDVFGPTKPIEPLEDGKVVKFRRPPPFGRSVDVPFKGKVS